MQKREIILELGEIQNFCFDCLFAFITLPTYLIYISEWTKN